MPEQEEKAPREGAKLSKSQKAWDAVEQYASSPEPIVSAAQAVGKGLGRVFNPISTEQEVQNTAAEARGTVDYMKQFKLWMNRFMQEYSPEEYGDIKDFLDAKERVMKELPFSEGQSRADLTDELAYNEAGEAHLQREAQRTRRAEVVAPEEPNVDMGSSLRNALRKSVPSGGL